MAIQRQLEIFGDLAAAQVNRVVGMIPPAELLKRMIMLPCA